MGTRISTADPGASAFDEEVTSAAARLHLEQMNVNEALVHKIFQCERAEAALRASEEKLRALLAHQFSHREDERRRIAVELHDSIAQNLLALRLDIAALHQHTAVRQTRLHDWVGAALANLDGTLDTIRHMITDLRPFQLELGQEAALEWECNKFRRNNGIACTLTGMEALHDLAIDDSQLLTLYRALQECLSNILRHANASMVDIALGVASEKLTMRVADNGVGIDPALPLGSAFGLMGMRERLADAGGSFALASLYPHGTVITIIIPLFAQK